MPEQQGKMSFSLRLTGIEFYLNLFSQNMHENKVFFSFFQEWGLKVWASYDFTQISNSTQLGGGIAGLSQGLAHARQTYYL